MPDSIQDILTQAENPAYIRVVVARLLLRQDLVARHDELEAELTRAVREDANENRLAVGPQIADDLLHLEDEMEAAKVEFRFASIGKRAWADLLAAHPPTAEQKKADPRVDHNPETFPIAAIAACCVQPVLSVDDATRLERALNQSQFDLLWSKCIDANVGGLSAPKSIAAPGLSRLRSLLSESSASVADGPSPAPSSSDE